MKDGLLMSRDNPNGRTLESVLTQLMNELRWKNAKIISDTQPCSVLIHANNNRIIEHLGASLALQESSMHALDAIKPNEGPTGKPRIGEGSKKDYGLFDIAKGEYIGNHPEGFQVRDCIALNAGDPHMSLDTQIMWLYEITAVDHSLKTYFVVKK